MKKDYEELLAKIDEVCLSYGLEIECLGGGLSELGGTVYLSKIDYKFIENIDINEN